MKSQSLNGAARASTGSAELQFTKSDRMTPDYCLNQVCQPSDQYFGVTNGQCHSLSQFTVAVYFQTPSSTTSVFRAYSLCLTGNLCWCGKQHPTYDQTEGSLHANKQDSIICAGSTNCKQSCGYAGGTIIYWRYNNNQMNKSKIGKTSSTKKASTTVMSKKSKSK